MTKFLSSSRRSSPRGNKEKPTIALSWVGSSVFLLTGCLLGHFHGRYGAEMTNAELGRRYHNYDTRTTTFQQIPPSYPKGDCNEIKNVHHGKRDDGWRSVDVFYGRPDLLERMLPQDEDGKPVRWFSQAAQDELVSGLLRGKQNGYFVDLAANDATVFSNTYALEQQYGW